MTYTLKLLDKAAHGPSHSALEREELLIIEDLGICDHMSVSNTAIYLSGEGHSECLTSKGEDANTREWVLLV